MAVTSFEIKSRSAYRDGMRFGDVGAYEHIEGVLHYAVDPSLPANQRIVDLALAPRGSDFAPRSKDSAPRREDSALRSKDSALRSKEGLVHFRGALSLLRPLDFARGNGCVLLDVPNRGRRLSLTGFNKVRRDLALTDPLHPGDGLLFTHGLTLATVGWQWDVDPSLGFWLDAPRALQNGAPVQGEVICQLRPERDCTTMHIGQLGAAPFVPVSLGSAVSPGSLSQTQARLYATDEHTHVHTLIPRDAWQFATETDAGTAPSGAHVYLRQGFSAGALFHLVFIAEGAPITGCGLLAVRDAAAWLRSGPFGTHEHVIGFGVSQTGRFLRQFLYEGMNACETGARAFDGLLVHIAGGQRGDFNHRFAQPSSAGAPSFGQLFPFSPARLPDPLSGRTAGLFDRCRAQDVVPKTFFTNTSWEYWRGDASFNHIGPDGSDIDEDIDEDADEDANVRIYHYAGTQHIDGVFPPTNENAMLPLQARYDFSIIEHAPLQRAALMNMLAWVREGRLPPPSRHPRIVDGSARSRADVMAEFPALPALVRLDPQTLTGIRAMTLTPDAGHTSYPVPEGAVYPAFVSAVDSDGNETVGIRLPGVAVPVGTHTGWNPRHPDAGAPELATIFVGFTRFFAGNATQRIAQDDPRPSVAERYADRQDYQGKVQSVIESLIDARFVLAVDAAALLKHCLAHYDWAMRQS